MAGLAGCLLGLFVGIVAIQARAQRVTDGSEAGVGAGIAGPLLARIGQTLHSTDARITGLRDGRHGTICGAVDVRNRSGHYTGARPFVYEPGTGFIGRLPEPPELRHPASAADYAALEHARTLFTQACTAP